MADWSPAIANEFIRRASERGRAPFTQMQLQKLVYISHGWTLAILESPLTVDAPSAFDYGPVYRYLWDALRPYGKKPILKPIMKHDYAAGYFDDENGEAIAELNENERSIIDRVMDDYGSFHAFQLSALTHQDGTPWTVVYDDGVGRFNQIPADLIKDHFVELAHARRRAGRAR